MHAAPLGFHLQTLSLRGWVMDRPPGHGAELPTRARSGSRGGAVQDRCLSPSPSPTSLLTPLRTLQPCRLYLLKDLISCISQLQSSRLDSWKSRKPAAWAVLHTGHLGSGSAAPRESQRTRCPPQHSPAWPWGRARLVPGDAQLCRVMPWHQEEATPCLGGSTEPAWGT